MKDRILRPDLERSEFFTQVFQNFLIAWILRQILPLVRIVVTIVQRFRILRLLS